MMTFETTAAWIFVGTFVATLTIVFPFRSLASRIGMLDRPDRLRKLQKQAIPVGGGIVIFLVMTVLMSLLIYYKDQIGFKLRLSSQLLLPFLVVSPLIILLGLIDDKWGINGKMKLLIQIFVSTVVIGFAKYYSIVSYFGVELNLHHLFYPLAILWIIALINAINLLDGADGVAVTVAFIMSIATTCIAYINGHLGIALISLGLAGSLAGFFWHNKPTARVYLGDTGSMFIGMTLAILMLRASIESERTISVCGPLAIVLIPAVDSIFAIIRRFNSGRTIFSPDRGHIHHLLSIKMASPYRVLLTLSLLVLPGCLAAVLGTYYRNDFIPLAVAVVVLFVVLGTDLFGRRELIVLVGRIRAKLRKAFHPQKYMRKNGEIYQIQGSGPWQALWAEILLVLKNKPCRHLRLDISIPALNEEFFSEWENLEQHRGSSTPTFDCRIPFMIEGRRVGTLRIMFEATPDSFVWNQAALAEISAICNEFFRKFFDQFSEQPDHSQQTLCSPHFFQPVGRKAA